MKRHVSWMIALILCAFVCPCKGAEEPAAKATDRASGSVTGCVISLNFRRMSLSVKLRGKEEEDKTYTFLVDDKTKLTHGGKTMAFKKLNCGDTVKVSYNVRPGKLAAASVIRLAVKKRKVVHRPRPTPHHGGPTISITPIGD